MIITLCGSARFEKEFKEANEDLTLKGHTVYSLAVYPSDKGDKNWYTESQKVLLDLAHLRKIMESDCIHIVGDGYIGFSTAREILWAKSLNKIIHDYSHEEIDWVSKAKEVLEKGDK